MRSMAGSSSHPRLVRQIMVKDTSSLTLDQSQGHSSQTLS